MSYSWRIKSCDFVNERSFLLLGLDMVFNSSLEEISHEKDNVKRETVRAE